MAPAGSHDPNEEEEDGTVELLPQPPLVPPHSPPFFVVKAQEFYDGDPGQPHQNMQQKDQDHDVDGEDDVENDDPQYPQEQQRRRQRQRRQEQSRPNWRKETLTYGATEATTTVLTDSKALDVSSLSSSSSSISVWFVSFFNKHENNNNNKNNNNNTVPCCSQSLSSCTPLILFAIVATVLILILILVVRKVRLWLAGDKCSSSFFWYDDDNHQTNETIKKTTRKNKHDYLNYCPMNASANINHRSNDTGTAPLFSSCPGTKSSQQRQQQQEHPLDLFQHWISSSSPSYRDNKNENGSNVQRLPLAARWLLAGFSGQDTPGRLRMGLHRLNVLVTDDDEEEDEEENNSSNSGDTNASNNQPNNGGCATTTTTTTTRTRKRVKKKNRKNTKPTTRHFLVQDEHDWSQHAHDLRLKQQALDRSSSQQQQQQQQQDTTTPTTNKKAAAMDTMNTITNTITNTNTNGDNNNDSIYKKKTLQSNNQEDTPHSHQPLASNIRNDPTTANHRLFNLDYDDDEGSGASCCCWVAESCSRAAQQECLELFLEYLPKQYPDLYQYYEEETNDKNDSSQNSSTRRTTRRTIRVHSTQQVFDIDDWRQCPLQLCARLVQEDLVLLRPGNDKDEDDEKNTDSKQQPKEQKQEQQPSPPVYRLAAAAVVHSFDQLEERLGQTLDFLHHPVPGYQEELAKAVNRTLSAIFSSSSSSWNNNNSISTKPNQPGRPTTTNGRTTRTTTILWRNNWNLLPIRKVPPFHRHPPIPYHRRRDFFYHPTSPCSPRRPSSDDAVHIQPPLFQDTKDNNKNHTNNQTEETSNNTMMSHKNKNKNKRNNQDDPNNLRTSDDEFVVDAVVDLNEYYLEVEYQTLRLLPKSNYILFTIKTMWDPIPTLPPPAASCLANSIRGRSNDFLNYKGLGDLSVRQAMLQFLDDNPQQESIEEEQLHCPHPRPSSSSSPASSSGRKNK